jgi:hypothetical protein
MTAWIKAELHPTHIPPQSLHQRKVLRHTAQKVTACWHLAFIIPCAAHEIINRFVFNHQLNTVDGSARYLDDIGY